VTPLEREAACTSQGRRAFIEAEADIGKLTLARAFTQSHGRRPPLL